MKMRMCAAAALLAGLLAPSGNLRGAIKPEGIPDLKPPQGALPPEPAGPSLWGWLALGVLVLLFVWLGIWLRRRFRTVLPIEAPYERASRELRALLHAAANPTAVVTIFQRYTAEALPLPGPGQTPAELCAFLARHPRWTPEHTARFHRLFDPVELAKFAPVPPPPGDAFVVEALALVSDIEEFRRWNPQPARVA